MFNGGRSSVGRAPDCDSGCRGFDPHRSPQIFSGPLAQLVEQLTLNQLVTGSTPVRPTTLDRKVCIILPHKRKWRNW